MVLITGAGGLIGSVLRRGLADAYVIEGLDRRWVRDRGIRRVDVTNRKKLARSFDGMLHDKSVVFVIINDAYLNRFGRVTAHYRFSSTPCHFDFLVILVFDEIFLPWP